MEESIKVSSYNSVEESRREEVLPSGKAIASLILSILALLTFFIPVLGVIGLIYGVGALREIRASGGRVGGAKAASAGVALAVVSFILAALFYGSGPSARRIAETYLIAEALKSYSEKHEGSLPQDLEEIAPLLKEQANVSLHIEHFVYLGNPSVRYGDKKIVVCSAQPIAKDFFLAIRADGKVKILKKEDLRTILSKNKGQQRQENPEGK